ncbi:RNA polymerase sigma factor [Chthoniobacter flavus]|nr:sigma-70 family RNA polymerase sigma factor [Chthoniobacter flavus]
MADFESADKASLFVTTRWSVVLAARDGEGRYATVAMETLCKTYWRALYVYARRHGLPPPDAEDVTQAFFERLLEKDYLKSVQPERGPFRAFLQMAFKRFLAKEHEHATALRRGGNAKHLGLDFLEAEAVFTADSPQLAADEVFEAHWAMTTLQAAMTALRAEFRDAGKEQDFDILKTTLSASGDGSSYEKMGVELGLSDGATRIAVHRLRKRFRELFRAEVAQTVASHEDLNEEIRHLVAVLARG